MLPLLKNINLFGCKQFEKNREEVTELSLATVGLSRYLIVIAFILLSMAMV